MITAGAEPGLMLTDESGKTGYVQLFGHPLPLLPPCWEVREAPMPSLDLLSANARRLIMAACAARCAWHLTTGHDSAGAPLHGVEVRCGDDWFTYNWRSGRLSTYGQRRPLRDTMAGLARRGAEALVDGWDR